MGRLITVLLDELGPGFDAIEWTAQANLQRKASYQPIKRLARPLVNDGEEAARAGFAVEQHTCTVTCRQCPLWVMARCQSSANRSRKNLPLAFMYRPMNVRFSF